jgi:tRNA(fMet)-specific endonuclease VapC
MPGYLLDSNILSDLVNRPLGGIAARRLTLVRAQGGQDVSTSIIVVAELRYGVAKRGSARLARQVEAMLGGIDVLPFEAPADAIYGQLRADLERHGQPLASNDLLIAAHALAAGLTLVTDDRGFDRIAELPRENWLSPD